MLGACCRCRLRCLSPSLPCYSFLEIHGRSAQGGLAVLYPTFVPLSPSGIPGASPAACHVDDAACHYCRVALLDVGRSRGLAVRDFRDLFLISQDSIGFFKAVRARNPFTQALSKVPDLSNLGLGTSVFSGRHHLHPATVLRVKFNFLWEVSGVEMLKKHCVGFSTQRQCLGTLHRRDSIDMWGWCLLWACRILQGFYSGAELVMSKSWSAGSFRGNCFLREPLLPSACMGSSGLRKE